MRNVAIIVQASPCSAVELSLQCRVNEENGQPHRGMTCVRMPRTCLPLVAQARSCGSVSWHLMQCPVVEIRAESIRTPMARTNKMFFMTGIKLQPTDSTELCEKSSNAVSSDRQRVGVSTRTYATWLRALPCPYLPVRASHGAPCPENKKTLAVPPASTSVTTVALMSPPCLI